MLKCASGACAAMLAILSFAPTFVTYLIAWLLVGVALGFMDTLLSSTMATLYSGKMATRMMCTMHMLYGVGSMLFPPAYAFLMRSGIAWNRIYLFTAGLGALICLAFTVFARGAGEILPKNEPEFSFPLLKTLLKNGVLPLLMIANFCNGVFMGGATTWLNRYVELRFDVSLGDLALSFLFLGVLASRLLLPMTPIDPKNYLIGAGPLAFIAFLFVILIPSPHRHVRGHFAGWTDSRRDDPMYARFRLLDFPGEHAHDHHADVPRILHRSDARLACGRFSGKPHQPCIRRRDVRGIPRRQQLLLPARRAQAAQSAIY